MSAWVTFTPATPVHDSSRLGSYSAFRKLNKANGSCFSIAAGVSASAYPLTEPERRGKFNV